ncbi:hypothetical protein SteCoe_3651 [Stentor coeruleus]|uniref:Anaphase-promoting complex subunit 4 WD40 domain-containing protein n=1 Tax=Stentor coeruleus TaxID=5963 RepID=A0A1R2CWL4_9CILI|nr:hypothetical protein SteCoe_3651 [Stentor coeruleus]
MESEELLHLSFNQDTTLLTTGSHHGFKVYRLNPFDLINQEDKGNFKIVEMYESSQLLILVGAGEQPAFSPRRLTIWNIAERVPICETAFPDTVLSVKMNRVRIVSVIIDAIYIFNTTTMKTQNTIRTVENPKGIVALSPTHSDCFLLYPASENKGHVQVYDCFSMQHRTIIEAHNSPLAYIAISYKGHLCATASIKGTMIRVFSLPEGNKLFTFKRGLTQAEIYNIMFSYDAKFLLACSSTGTIHVYDIRNDRISQEIGWGNSIKQSFMSAASYLLPENYRDTFETSRSFVTARTHFNKKYISALVNKDHYSKIVAVSFSAEYLIFTFNSENGGEAVIEACGSLNKIIQTQIKAHDEEKDLEICK